MKTTLPYLTGLGLRSPHLPHVLETRPDVAWWEVHSENYFGGGKPVATLEQIRRDYPVSLHGVGLGLGSISPLDPHHLQQLKQLIERIEPAAVSEHLAWNHFDDRYFNDLLPVPRVKGVIEHLTQRIEQVQDTLQRTILIENVSAYVGFAGEIVSEAELMVELAQSTGCGLLVDLNNFHVNTLNLGLNAQAELARIPGELVEEIHIAGFEWFEGTAIDTHGAPISREVLDLLALAGQQWGSKPVLLERDNNLGHFTELHQEYVLLSQYIKSLNGNNKEVYA